MDDALYFINGLERVNKIIDYNPRYDLLLGERLSNPWYDKIFRNSKLDETELRAYIDRRVRNSRKIYELSQEVTEENVAGFFPTLNNKRERDFLIRNLSDASYKAKIPDISELSVVDCDLKEATNDSGLIDNLVDYLLSKKHISLSNIHQSISYFFSFRVASNTLSTFKGLSLFVLANDHSPVPVAFWAAAKNLGIKTLYVQHAEVTESFPPLDFDFAILRNRASGEIYKRIEKNHCQMVFGARESRTIDINSLMARRNIVEQREANCVVIYLTAIFNSENVTKLVRALKASTHIEHVSIKPHPSFWKVHDSNIFQNVALLSDHVDTPHIAVCGNSSVVLELLEKGNVVVQDFSLDDIKLDYYGFVRNGLVKEVNVKAICQGNVEALIAENSIEALSEYLPHLNNKRNKLDKCNFTDFISKLNTVYFNNESRARIRTSPVFYISVVPLSFSRIINKRTDSWLNELPQITILNVAFDNRNVDLLEFFPLIDFNGTKTALKFWMQSKRIEWNGYRPDNSDLKAMIGFALENACERRLKGWLETKAFDIALRANSHENVVKVLTQSKLFSLKKSPANRIVSFKKYIATRPTDEQKKLSSYLPSDAELSSLSKLKIELQGTEPGTEADFNYRELESRFMKAHASIEDDYKNFVISAYNNIRGREKLIDVKYNQVQRMSLIDRVKDALTLRKGFSFIRLSDGEGFIFREQSVFFNEEDSLNRQRHWWGRELSESHETLLRSRLLEAVTNADLLGIPSVYRFIRDHSDKTKSLSQSIQGRGLLSVLSAIQTIDTPDKLYTDDKANTAVFKNVEILNNLNNLAKDTILVTSGREEILAQLFEDKSKLKFIQVPTHQKTSSNTNYVKGDLPLPYHLDELQVELKRIVTGGSLVLVGAGVAGKVFCDIAKQNSAVGLDLGSVFDELVGGGIHSLF
ncbi:hypothetical protein [Idiomarina ramblicola]|uniref:GT-D fold-like domain-containing protein n=1 Tax=Idiomarina ramblicola TaxID=263724 RepID=A0A432Z1M0_9GAMM|nr:hypothetical protein [Idiomarina ramblicola]RUO71790.1 hypothetical protein CWI78_04540 [Idiomarina ramblicola]